MDLAKDIKQKAIDLGFDLAGITDSSALDTRQVEILAGWLQAGFAGQMEYLHKNFDKRINPAELLENAQSVIVVGLNYNQRPLAEAAGDNAAVGRVSTYAQYEDYHLFIKKQLSKLVDFLVSIAGDGFRFKICVDSVPLAERALAERAGLGFIGRNHMLLNPEFGCQILLGEIITDLALVADKPISGECKNCDRCIAACPSGAIRADGQFNANKCISYLTTEYKGQIATDLAGKMGNRLFGCDNCVMVCPHQKNAPVCRNKQFRFFKDRATLDLRWVLNLTEEEFTAEFGDSCIKRLGLERLKRNARICMENIAGGKD